MRVMGTETWDRDAGNDILIDQALDFSEAVKEQSAQLNDGTGAA